MKCFECDSEDNLHNHHAVPRVLGGTKTIPLCGSCHGKVHSRDMTSTRALIKAALKKRKDTGIKLGRPKKKIDMDMLKTLYVDKKYTLKQCGESVGLSEASISRIVNSNGWNATEEKEMKFKIHSYESYVRTLVDGVQKNVLKPHHDVLLEEEYDDRWGQPKRASKRILSGLNWDQMAMLRDELDKVIKSKK